MVFRLLLLLFIVVPLAELYLLFKISAAIGFIPTVLLVIVTATAGAWCAKRQGLETLSRIRRQLSMGVIPGDELIDGALIFAAGMFLLTPGFLTDAFGLSLLVPCIRRRMRIALKRFFSNRIAGGGMRIL